MRLSTAGTQRRLVAGLKAGQAEAWRELCQTYGEALFLYAYHRMGEATAAEDIRQETLLAAVVVLGYDVSPLVGAPPDLPYLALLLTGLAGFTLYWLGLPLWTALDARARGDAALLWGLFILLTNLVGLVAYLIVIRRPARGAAAPADL